MGCINNLVFCCLIVFGILIPVNGMKNVAKGVQTFRFTKIECWTSGITLMPNYQCYVKAYSRTYATMNVVWKFNRPLTDFKASVTMEYKYVTTFRQTYATESVDFCSLMNKNTIPNVFYEMVFNAIRDSVNGLQKVATGVQTFRFNKVECLASGKTLLPKHECFVKSYSRSYATMNINWKFNRPLTDFKFSVAMEYKYVTTFRQVFKTKDVDFCYLMENKSIASTFFEMVISVIRESGLDSILHHCPYNDVIAYNFSMTGDSVFSVFPSGDYRCIEHIIPLKAHDLNYIFLVTGHLSDSIDPKIVAIRLYVKVVSPIKTSF
ncbi:unnamed protein product [Diamesa tonsa]